MTARISLIPGKTRGHRPGLQKKLFYRKLICPLYSDCPLRFPKRALLDHILNLLFPVTCSVCHARVPERRRGGACPQCSSSRIPVEPPFCPKCAEPARAAEGVCGLCLRGEHLFDFARSALLFTHTFGEIIHHLKCADRVSLARPLGRILKQCLDHRDFKGEIIVPVPLNRSRERTRGFNPAELIAEGLGRPSPGGSCVAAKTHPVRQVSHEASENAIFEERSKQLAFTGASLWWTMFTRRDRQ